MIEGILPRIYSFGNTLGYLLPDRLTYYLIKFTRFVHIFAVEGFATVQHVLPASVRWFYEYDISQNITSIKIIATKTTHYAHLYLHGKLNVKNKEVTPTLIVHGDWGHPFSTLHLAKIAEAKGSNSVFSLYLPKAHDNTILKENSLLLKDAIDQIEQLITKTGGIFKGVRGVGHSKGAILLAERQFVHEDPRLKGVFAVGGRLNVPAHDSSCAKELEPFVKNIFNAIRKDSEKLLVHIVPENDWNSSREAMAVRPLSHCHIVPGMHLSGLYSDRTNKEFERFLEYQN